jgi:hypothetical protein
MRASDEERNAVADKLSRHFAEGRLDSAEFKTRLDAAMSAKTRGELNGLFYDLPRLPADPPPPPPKRQRILPYLCLFAVFVIVAGALLPWWPLYHVPWVLFAIIGFLIWRRATWHSRSYYHHTPGGGGSVTEH